MNYSTAVMLINSNIRAIKTIYEPDTDKQKQSRYLFKTLDKDIKVGDFVVVPTDTRHNMTVVEVVEVDADVDFESGVEIKWIMSRVDMEKISNVLAEETKWIEALKASEKRKKREEIKKNMLDMYANEDIAALPIASMTDTPVIEHKE